MKIISTGVAELLAIKAPQHTTGWAIGNGVIYLSSVAVKLPPGNWEPLGLSDQLTEEQCAELLPYSCNSSMLPYTLIFASLMQANGCYSVNPLGPDLCKHNRQCYDSCQGSCWTRADIDSEEWQQAEENTGPHLILKNIL